MCDQLVLQAYDKCFQKYTILSRQYRELRIYLSLSSEKRLRASQFLNPIKRDKYRYVY